MARRRGNRISLPVTSRFVSPAATYLYVDIGEFDVLGSNYPRTSPETLSALIRRNSCKKRMREYRFITYGTVTAFRSLAFHRFARCKKKRSVYSKLEIPRNLCECRKESTVIIVCRLNATFLQRYECDDAFAITRSRVYRSNRISNPFNTEI